MVSCHIFSLGCGASAAYVWAVSVSRTLAHRPDGCTSLFWREGPSFGRRKYRPGYSPANTQVGFSRQMTANPDLGIRFWTPSSVFVALPPLRQSTPPPAIRGDSVAALALERTHRQGHHRQLPQAPPGLRPRQRRDSDRRGAQGGGGTHQAAPRSHGADRGRAALLLISATVLMQLLKLLVTFTVVLVTFTVVLVTFTTLLVTFTVVLVQQFLILVTCEM